MTGTREKMARLVGTITLYLFISETQTKRPSLLAITVNYYRTNRTYPHRPSKKRKKLRGSWHLGLRRDGNRIPGDPNTGMSRESPLPEGESARVRHARDGELSRSPHSNTLLFQKKKEQSKPGKSDAANYNFVDSYRGN